MLSRVGGGNIVSADGDADASILGTYIPHAVRCLGLFTCYLHRGVRCEVGG